MNRDEQYVKQAEQMMVMRQWQEKWPHYCRSCEGAGAVSWYESHGLPGPGEQFVEPCCCIERGNCPRCGNPTFDPESGDPPEKCSACGWEVNKPDQLPQVMEILDDPFEEYDAHDSRARGARTRE